MSPAREQAAGCAHSRQARGWRGDARRRLRYAAARARMSVPNRALRGSAGAREAGISRPHAGEAGCLLCSHVCCSHRLHMRVAAPNASRMHAHDTKKTIRRPMSAARPRSGPILPTMAQKLRRAVLATGSTAHIPAATGDGPYTRSTGGARHAKACQCAGSRDVDRESDAAISRVCSDMGRCVHTARSTCAQSAAVTAK